MDQGSAELLAQALHDPYDQTIDRGPGRAQLDNGKWGSSEQKSVQTHKG